MRVLLAILLPFTAFFRLHRTGAGVVSLLLQLTVVGWLPAALWAMYALGQASASQHRPHAHRTHHPAPVHPQPTPSKPAPVSAKMPTHRRRY